MTRALLPALAEIGDEPIFTEPKDLPLTLRVEVTSKPPVVTGRSKRTQIESRTASARVLDWVARASDEPEPTGERCR